MGARQSRTLFAAIMAVVAAWVLASLAGGEREFQAAAPDTPLQFDAARALQTTREFVTRHPRRVLGSLEARQSTGFLQQRLQDLGYEVDYAHFDAKLAGRKEVGRNVFAFKQGRSQEIVALVAHYDTARTTEQGAMDNGSGIAVLLELARIFAGASTRRSLLFVATDGEEWGMLGAADFVNSYPERQRLAVALSLDSVAAGELAALRLDTVGQSSGYTPPWLRQVARRAVAAEGIPLQEPAGLREHLERALLLSANDQGPFLHAGIPAVNLGSASRDAGRDREIRHSSSDTIENMQAAAFGIYGRTAERILRGLDEIPSFPRESMGCFRMAAGIVLSPATVSVLHSLAFLPLLAMAYFHFASQRRTLRLAPFGREALATAFTMLPFLVFYACIRLWGRLRLLPDYSFYPGTLKDPALASPAWGTVAGISAVALLTAGACYMLFRFWYRKSPRPDYFPSKAILLVFLVLVVILALLYNSYWAVGFLLLPGWLWGLAGQGRRSAGRAAGRALILAAGAPYLAVSCFYAARLWLGWNLIWYEVLALRVGMFRWEAYFLATAAVSIGIRFLLIQGASEARP